MNTTAEFDLLNELLPDFKKFGRVQVLSEVQLPDRTLPIYGLELGTENPNAPTFGVFGGVHGVERVGSHVLVHHLRGLLAQLKWDLDLQETLRKVRLFSIPIVNPGGMYLAKRSNPRGVDIMRNGPRLPGEKGVFLVSGQSYSPRLPWFHGNDDLPEVETKALMDFVKRNSFSSPFAMSLDIHSGFGMRDRLWYPFSHTREEFPQKEKVLKFKTLLRASLPHHVYKIEPQTQSYVVHGDPWDHLYYEYAKANPKGIYIPWCLEMGSWTWLRKNPKQIFFSGGLYNPYIPHRYNRIMRRHRGLLDIFLRATVNYQAWIGSE